MLLCIQMSQQTKRGLDSLIASGDYRDYSEAIAVAVANLEVMQRDAAEDGTELVRGQPKCLALQQDNTGERRVCSTSEPGQAVESSGKKAPSATVIPDIFKLGGGTLPTLAPVVSQDAEPGKVITIDRWLFGQYNKMLPAKVTCRAMLNLQLKTGGGIVLEGCASVIADAAAKLGDMLSEMDTRTERRRWDGLAVGFPRTGQEAQKGRSRYACHFVGTLSGTAQLTGLLVGLRLMGLVDASSREVGLTTAGYKFAEIVNPILDDYHEGAVARFSAEEIDFLLRHIRENVPVEDRAYRTLIEMILEGKNTPETMDSTLGMALAVDVKRNMTQSYLSSQRSGAISRMADIGLITRVSKGTKVFYEATDLGHRYLADVQSASKEGK